VVDVALRDVLTERTGLPVIVDNDATVAALAEACDDAGEVIHRDLAMLTVGTGIGGGVILGGRIFRGATGAAPELGHLLVALDLTDGAPPPGDDFPQDGSLERRSAGRVLDALARERASPRAPPPSPPRRTATPPRSTRCASSASAWASASPTSSTPTSRPWSASAAA
jgi:glucokinase